jgi:hypothetical protein
MGNKVEENSRSLPATRQNHSVSHYVPGLVCSHSLNMHYSRVVCAAHYAIGLNCGLNRQALAADVYTLHLE